jgi:hypothetical protein
VKPAEILYRLNAQYWEEILLHLSVCDWYKCSDGCKGALNMLCAHNQPTAVLDVNIYCAKELILGSVGSIEEVVREYLFKKVCAYYWVPKMSAFDKGAVCFYVLLNIIILKWKKAQP